MKKRNVDNLTIEIPDGLDSYNSLYQLKVSNNGNEDVEIKLYLEPLTTENINGDWYTIEPNFARVQGQGLGADFVLTIISAPIINNSSEEVVEEVKLMMVKNTGQTESLVFKYSLIIPPATPEKPAISLLDVGLRLTQVETLLNQKQDVGEIQALQTKIDKLETENASLKQQVRDCQSDILQLEQTNTTKIENLETALQEEKTKVNRLLEIEEKKRRLTEDLGNGIVIELVEIPAGKFLMGGREITLKSFLIGKYPVTQAQWQAVMGDNPSHFGGDNLPVDSISWHDAQNFCSLLQAKSGCVCRLPSDAEWEYAARAFTTTAFFFGDDEKKLDKYAWYGNNSNKETHRVGEKLANPWGLYDILGNLWEWCQDDWQEGYDHIPTDGTCWLNNSNTKCCRGGSWGTIPASNCRSNARGNDDAKSCTNNLGLRVVMLPGAL